MIVIEHNGVKRRLSGKFKVSGSSVDLHRLAQHLREQTSGLQVASTWESIEVTTHPAEAADVKAWDE